jgi:hypothetical protein
MFQARRVALLGLAFLPLKLPAAQQADCRTRIVPVSVYGGKASSVRVNGSSFTGTYQGRSVQIASVAIRQPQRLVLIVDKSGSMSDNSGSMDRLATDLIAHIPSDLEIGAVFFSDKVQTIISPSRDHQRLATEIHALKNTEHGGTALWDSIRDAITAFQGTRVGDAFYVITDGADNRSKSAPYDVAHALIAQGIRLFAVKLKPQGERRQFPGDPLALQVMVANTGGLIIDFDSMGPVSQALIQLHQQYELLLTFAALTIQLPEAPHKAVTWKLALSNSQPENRHLTLLYPTMIVPCG